MLLKLLAQLDQTGNVIVSIVQRSVSHHRNVAACERKRRCLQLVGVKGL